MIEQKSIYTIPAYVMELGEPGLCETNANDKKMKHFCEDLPNV